MLLSVFAWTAGCSGPVHTAAIVATAPDAAQPLHGSYDFLPLSPQGADIEVRARTLVAAALSAHGMAHADAPTYLVDVGVSARPGRVGVYIAPDKADAPRDDVPPKQPFYGLCNDQSIRVSVVLIDRQSGRRLSGSRSGQVQCEEQMDVALARLTDAAVAAAVHSSVLAVSRP